MLKLAALAALLTISASAADFRAHFTGASLDVYVAEIASARADVPGAPNTDNRLIVTVKTSDDLAHAVSVWIMVRLDDGTRTTRRAILARPYWTDGVAISDDRLAVTFSLGDRRIVEVVDIRVSNLRESFADSVSRAY